MAKQTILIVDDEASIRDMVAMTLELNGFDCLEAADAITAHSLIVDQRPDLVLLDWMMPGTSGQIDCAGLQLDTQAHRISANGTPIKLGPTEYRLLQFFMSHADRVYTREQLLDMGWGSNVYIDDRTLDVHIRRLRKALTVHGYDQYIHGYRFSSNLN